MKNQTYFQSRTLKICHAEQRVIIKKDALNGTTSWQGKRGKRDRVRRLQRWISEWERGKQKKSLSVADDPGDWGEERRHKYVLLWAIFGEKLWHLLQVWAKASVIPIPFYFVSLIFLFLIFLSILFPYSTYTHTCTHTGPCKNTLAQPLLSVSGASKPISALPKLITSSRSGLPL